MVKRKKMDSNIKTARKIIRDDKNQRTLPSIDFLLLRGSLSPSSSSEQDQDQNVLPPILFSRYKAYSSGKIQNVYLL